MPTMTPPRPRPTRAIAHDAIDVDRQYVVDLRQVVTINGHVFYPRDEHFFRGAILKQLMEEAPDAVAGSQPL